MLKKLLITTILIVCTSYEAVAEPSSLVAEFNSAYCQRDWGKATNLADKLFYASSFNDPNHKKWLNLSTNTLFYKLNTKQPSSEEWASICDNPTASILKPASKAPCKNSVKTSDGRVINFCGLDGADSTAPITSIPSSATNNYTSYSSPSYPNYGTSGGCVGSCPVNVRGYTRNDGTYVAPYRRSAPRR